jgi:molybdopterin biosynthesis enzyme
MLKEMGAVAVTSEPISNNPKALSEELDKALLVADVAVLSAGARTFVTRFWQSAANYYFTA